MSTRTAQVQWCPRVLLHGGRVVHPPYLAASPRRIADRVGPRTYASTGCSFASGDGLQTVGRQGQPFKWHWPPGWAAAALGRVSKAWLGSQLEWVEGEIWANVWMTECIARIRPQDGLVLGWINMGGLLAGERRARPQARIDVLNGTPPPPPWRTIVASACKLQQTAQQIHDWWAYLSAAGSLIAARVTALSGWRVGLWHAGIAWDGGGKRLFVTGKWWHKLYQVQVVETPQASLEATRSVCISRHNFQF